MKLPSCIETALAGIIFGVANAASTIPRWCAALGRRLIAPGRHAAPAGPDDGAEGAGVTARLQPPPPILSAAAALPLPGPDGSTA